MSRLPSLGARGEGWFAIQVVLGLAIIVGGEFLHFPAPIELRYAGIALGVVGAAVVLAGSATLGRWISPLPHPTSGPLRTSGLYSWIRHPIYVGVVLLAIGFSFWVASLPSIALTIGLAFFFDLKARREEAWLSDHYPDYPAYARRTRRFIPGLY